MRRPNHILTALSFGLLLAACQPYAPSAATASQQAQTASTEQASLQRRIDSFNAGFEAGDYFVVTDVLPPRLLGLMSKRAGMPPSALQKLLLSSTQDVMSSAKVHSSVMTIPEGAIKPAGKLHYALLPTKTDITILGQRRQQETTTVALKDSGKWYLIRVETAQHEADIKTAYPELRAVKIL